ncbi:DUF89 domain-containing protein [Cantharellus anzutake]|uniref:DUF89 domain-containing protein n=1 Tax=Cantharellus anzutake TaxID=1750568 RepID=UPI001904DB80|nr:DUF89 domain-containing protein [Cantharellus anzutake]KAF8335911.1 DUF89 domain-containing protein [Cantharellus anzutake]
MSQTVPPVAPWSPKDKDSRWPVILTSIIDNIYRRNHNISMGADRDSHVDMVNNGKELISKLAELKYGMAHNRALVDLPDDGGLDIVVYNRELKRLEEENNNTWFTAPWLFAEYRLIRAWFALMPLWQQYDPFLEQKTSAFKASGNAIYHIANTMLELGSGEKGYLKEEQLEILFDEMIQMCLWGNATDLSLLPTMDYSDIHTLQSVGKAARAAGQAFILRNDSKAVWQLVRSLKDARIDIILDNSPLQLFTDLVLADFLVTHTPFVSQVIFHPKLIPWFVSDVVPGDYAALLSSSTDWASFFNSGTSEEHSKDDIRSLDELMSRWRAYVSDGTFKLAVDPSTPLGIPSPTEGDGTLKTAETFWTLPNSFWSLPSQEILCTSLKGSGLVIFKGDLKLTADVKWPPTTSFSDAIGPVRGLFPILSLRTCKAEVVVGLEEGVAERLSATEPGWRVTGKYGLISLEP